MARYTRSVGTLSVDTLTTSVLLVIEHYYRFNIGPEVLSWQALLTAAGHLIIR